MARRQLAVMVVVLASACGGSAATETAGTTPASPTDAVHSETTTTQPPSTSSTAPATSTGHALQPLDSMRYAMSVDVEPLEGGALLPVGSLEGLATKNPPAIQLTGNLLGEPLSLASDGTRWWDLDDPAYEITNDDIAIFLLANAFIQPDDIAHLIAGSGEWETVGVETHLGVPVDHIRRINVEKGLDWDYGSLSQLDVWRDATGGVVKLIARFATGDNEGFPLATWELIERNPTVDISIPTG